MEKVAIIMGSQSDWPVMEKAQKLCRDFGVECECKVISAHRTPHDMLEFAMNASKSFGVIIAGAGGAAHLPGMIAAATTLPVIGVPIKLKALDGMDSLLSIVQMPRGVPVATVAIDNGVNAALLAIRILGLSNSQLVERLTDYQQKMAKQSKKGQLE